jgi:kynurenine formamidase
MYVYLSHPLAPDTPCFRNTREVVIARTRDLDAGAPVNNHRFEVGAHNGTHVDAPFHFVRGGRTIEAYGAGDWVFERPALIRVPKDDSELIGPADLEPHVAAAAEADAILLKTGFERWRQSDPARYASRNPGFSVAGARFFYEAFPRCRLLGMDVISLAAVAHLEEGFAAHRELLFADRRSVLLVEDMRLTDLERAPARVIVLPLRMAGADGAPVTAIAEVA